MYVPSLQPISSSHFCVSGDVVIHPTATIAAGVLLQADPGSQVIVGAGVCLGMGTVLHAHQGTVEIGTEATIGTGVLIVGSSKIGANVCIGSASTIWNHSIDRGTVIPPLSLLGAVDRQSAESSKPEPSNPEAAKPEAAQPEATPVPVPTANLAVSQPPLNGATTAPASKQPTAEIQLSVSTPIYGQANLNRLLSTLLPHRQSFIQNEANGGEIKEEE